MNSLNQHTAKIAFFFTIVFSLGACDKMKAASTKDGAADSTAATTDAEAGDGTSKATTPCAQLTEKLCKEAGEKGPTCAGAKSTLALISEKACTAGLADFSGTQAKIKEMAKDCEKLITTLCAGVGAESKSCDMVRTQTKKFPPEQCTQMLTQTDEIIANLKKEELKNQPLSADLQKAIAKSGAPGFGPEDAKVLVVEFSDFECPYCSRAATVTNQLKEKYGDKVRFVFRQFPLSFHKSAQGAAEASMAAHAQGKFWKFHDLMFQNQKALSRKDLDGYAKKAGLNMAQFTKDMDTNKFAEEVKGDIALGSQAAVSGTPTLFVNGARIANPTDLALVSKEIDAALGS